MYPEKSIGALGSLYGFNLYKPGLATLHAPPLSLYGEAAAALHLLQRAQQLLPEPLAARVVGQLHLM